MTIVSTSSAPINPNYESDVFEMNEFLMGRYNNASNSRPLKEEITDFTRHKNRVANYISEIIAAVERLAVAGELEVGGIEYLIDDRDGSVLFYDINGLSNFVARPVEVLGFDPHDNLVEWLKGIVAEEKAKRDASGSPQAAVIGSVGN